MLQVAPRLTVSRGLRSLALFEVLLVIKQLRGNTDRRGCPRNCKQRVRRQSPLGNREGRPRAMTCQPGDLPR